MKSYLDELKQGDLIAVSYYGSFSKGMFMSANQESVKFRSLPWVSNSKHEERIYALEDRLTSLEEGTVKLGQIDFIRSYLNYRVLPISEDILTPIEKRYLKFYRTYLNNEYKNNRSGYTL
jgi:hypothetical protein